MGSLRQSSSADEIGRPLTPSTLSSTFARHVREAKVPRLTLHGLRHTFAKLGLEAGVDTVYVSEPFGTRLADDHNAGVPAHAPGAARGRNGSCRRRNLQGLVTFVALHQQHDQRAGPMDGKPRDRPGVGARVVCVALDVS